MPIINGQGGQAKFVINKLYAVDNRLIALYYNGAIEDITGLRDLYNREGIVLPDPIVLNTIPDFDEATDGQIDTAIKLAQNGIIDLGDYWTVGDTRAVSLSAMDATDVRESHAAQTVELTVMHSFKNNGSLGGISADKGSLLVGLKDNLKENGYMNSSNTNAGGWRDSARRIWCNNVFPNSLPDCFKNNMLEMAIKTYNSSLSVTTDKAALWAEKEIFGSRSYSWTTEADALTQVEYYKTAANRIKKTNGSAHYWWERSPISSDTTYFCLVYNNGSANLNAASNAFGLAPFFCI